MNVAVLFVKQDRVRVCEAVNCFQDCVEDNRTFCTVEEKRAFRRLDELGLFLFEKSRCARILRFSVFNCLLARSWDFSSLSTTTKC